MKDGGPAFPHDGQANYTGGMSLRAYFAAKAMQGILAHYGDEGDYDKLSSIACRVADALLAELERE